MPILSLGLLFTKSVATTLRASRRFGFKSLASILAETSIAITISIPLLALIFLLTATFLGLASATISKANAINLITASKGLTFGKILFFVLKPFRLETVKTAVSFLRIKKNQTAVKGIRINSHKNSGL